MDELQACMGETWERRREEMLTEFASIMLHSLSVCVGCAVDAEYFRGMPDSKFKQDMKNPIFLALHTVVMNVLEAIDRNVGGEKSVSLVFDDDQEFAMSCYEFVDALRTQFPIAKRIDSICFVNDKAYAGVQAADMIAYEWRSLLTKRMTDPQVEPSLLYVALTRKLLHQPKIYTPYLLGKLQRDWK